jgi:hypothetical protein
METILVIIILLTLAYYLHNCWIENKIEKILKTKEGFANTVNTSDPDLVKSITTLGQICKDLQSPNGLTVPGKMNCNGGVNVTGTLVVNSRDILTELDSLKNLTNKFAHDLDYFKTDIGYIKDDIDNIKKSPTCRTAFTNWDYDSIGHGVEYLDRHKPQCNNNESISAIYLERSDNGRGNGLRYNYTCCS